MSEQTKKESWGAWKKQTAKGEVINFTLGGVKYSMWNNSYKKEENHPDYVIYINDFVLTPKEAGIEADANTKDLPF
jgi:hypothetical protein